MQRDTASGSNKPPSLLAKIAPGLAAATKPINPPKAKVTPTTRPTPDRHPAPKPAKVKPLPLATVAPALAAATKPPTRAQQKTFAAQDVQIAARKQRTAARKQAFYVKRAAALKDIQTKVDQGKISSFQGHQQLQQMGFVPGFKAAYKVPSGVGGFAAKTIGNLTEAALYSVPGALHASAQVARDVNAAKQGDLTFPRTRELGKQIGESTYQDLRHPLRNPGYTALDVLTLGSLAAGTGARIGAASAALEREGALGAAKALLKRPEPGFITYKEGGLEVKTPASRNALTRQGQRFLARRGNPRRLGKALAQEQRLSSSVEGASAKTAQHLGRRLTTAQQTALRVVDEGKSIDERIAAHAKEFQKATGAERKRIGKKIGLLQAAKPYVRMVNGEPVLASAFDTPRFRVRRGANPAELKAAQVAARAETIKATAEHVRAGTLDVATAADRIHLPGRVVEGARFQYDKVPNSRVREVAGQLKRAEKKYNKAVVRRDEVLAARVGKEAAPNTVDWKGVAADLRKDDHGYSPSEIQALVRYGQDKYGFAKRAPEQFVSYAGRQVRKGSHLHGKALYQAIIRNETKAAPAAKTLSDAERIRFAGREEASVQHWGARLSGAKERMAALENGRNLRTTKNGRLVGSDFKGGKGYVSYAPKPKRVTSTFPTRFRGGKPSKLPELTHAFTGESFRKGLFRDDVTNLAAEGHLAASRYSAIVRLRDRILQAGKDESFEGSVPVKTDAFKGKSLPPEAKALLERASEGVKLSKQEETLARGALRNFYDQAFPKDSYPAGVKVPGVKFVDERLLRAFEKPAPVRGLIGHIPLATWDEINNAAKMAILYLKPAYAAPNILGNAVMTLIQQGWAAPKNLLRSARANAVLGPKALHVLDSVMSEGFFKSIGGEGRGLLGPAVTATAGAWGKVVDIPFRRASWFHEAAKAGFKTAQEQVQLLTDPALHDRLLEVSQRANDAIIDYGRLGPREQEYIRRLVFIYPWIKGSTRYAGHFVSEHPAQALIGTQLAKQAKAQELKDFGPTPLWAKGLVKVGQRGSNPLAIQTQGISPFGGGISVGQMVGGLLGSNPLSPSADIVQGASPFIQAGLSLVQRRDLYTGRRLTGGPLSILNKTLVQGTPQYQLAQRILSPGDQSNRVYPYTKTDALDRFGPLGSVAPTPVNRKALNKRALQELGSDPSQTARRTVFARRQSYYEAAKKLKLLSPDGKLGPKTRSAFNVEAERQAAYSKASHGEAPGTAAYHLARYRVDIQMLTKYHWISQNAAKKVLVWAKTASVDDLKAARAEISRKYYQGPNGQLEIIGVARQIINDAGGKVR